MSQFQFSPIAGIKHKARQITASIINDIEKGVLKKNDQLPSINEFSVTYKFARDTVERAYKDLKKQGYIISIKSIGFFVKEKKNSKLKILLIFNKISYFKKVVYDNFVTALGNKAKVDLCIYHYRIDSLKEIIEENIGNYHYYVVMPHFLLKTPKKQYIDLLKTFIPGELLLLDKDVPELGENRKGVIQDFEHDIYNALTATTEALKKYSNVILAIPEHSNHPQEIRFGVRRFCKDTKKKLTELNDVDNEKITAGTLYILTFEDDLAILIKKVRKSSFKLGKEIGIISFNETALKEVLDIAVISTDFAKMGQSAAAMILNNVQQVQFNPFQIIKRSSI